MGKLKIVGLALVLAVLILGVSFFIIGYLKPKSAGLLIETNPEATVFINGEQVGRTKYDETMKPGEVTIKLVPDSFDKPLAPYETKLNLVSGIKTILQRDFGDSEKTSSGVTISFEKIGGDETGLSVISTPDESQVTVDGQIRGFTPYKTTTITEGEHEIMVSSQGYADKVVLVKTRKSHQLTADVKLAPGGDEVKEEEKQKDSGDEPLDEESGAEELDQIEIIDTPTGFLRVRVEPSTLAKEVAQVDPGDTFDLLDTDEDTGWYKIEYEEGSEGWISNKYAKIVGEEEKESN